MRVLALGLVAAIAACSIFDPDDGDLQSELDANRSAWESLAYADYDFRLQISCFCPPEITQPVRVAVRDDVIASLTYVVTDDPVPAQHRGVFLTVDGLFDRIQDAIDGGADSITVVFDPELFYPTSIAIDYELQTADEEIAYEARDLIPVRSVVLSRPH